MSRQSLLAVLLPFAIVSCGSPIFDSEAEGKRVIESLGGHTIPHIKNNHVCHIKLRNTAQVIS